MEYYREKAESERKRREKEHNDVMIANLEGD